MTDGKRSVQAEVRLQHAESRTVARDKREQSLLRSPARADFAPRAIPRSGAHYPLDMRRMVHDLAATGESASRIHEQLVKAFPQKDTPALRTVQKIVADARHDRERDRSGPWQLDQTNGQDATVILPVLAAFRENVKIKGRTYLTRDEAAWIVTIGRAAPDLVAGHPFLVYKLAASAAAGDSSGIDDFLAFSPWRGPAEASRYVWTLEHNPPETETTARSRYVIREGNQLVEYDVLRLDPSNEERRFTVGVDPANPARRVVFDLLEPWVIQAPEGADLPNEERGAKG